MATRCSNRKLFASERGYLGLGPAAVLPGDIIAAIFGLETPLVLRSVGTDSYQIVGEAYVHGIMDGEAMKGSLSTGTFNIVDAVLGNHSPKSTNSRDTKHIPLFCKVKYYRLFPLCLPPLYLFFFFLFPN